MISYAEALRRVRQHSPLLGVESVPAAHALGRVLAQPLRSPADLPGFDNSAMDGCALPCAGELLPAGTEFELAGMVAAGSPAPQLGGAAWQIMTGAIVPPDCATVVPIEQIEVTGRDAAGRIAAIRLRQDARRGVHIRCAGEDIRRGDAVLAAGSLLGPAQQMLCAALGIAEVPVARQAKLALISTGNELVVDPAQGLVAGQIRDCNGPYLRALLSGDLAQIVFDQAVPDRTSAYTAALSDARAEGADIIVSSGAVSMGELDFIPAALANLGGEMVFHKLRIRPGKPLLFATLPGGALYFGLPGNPLAAAVGARFVVSAALRQMAGLAVERPLRLPLVHRTRKKPGMTSMLKAKVQVDEGRARVSLLAGQESFRIRPLLEANAWAILDEDGDHCEQDQLVDVVGLDGPFAFGAP